MHHITILIPTYNEEKFIASCLDSVLNQDYPKEKMEVLVIDGMSLDNTRAIVSKYCNDNFYIRLLDNPEKIVPYALNYGIKKSKGEVIIRMDAHSHYPINYFSRLVSQLDALKADNVGGVWNTLPAANTPLCQSIAIGSSHRFGIGNSLHKIGAAEIIETDTVPFGCFRRDIFEKIGLFDVDLIRNQDDEFNARIIKNGGKIYLIPDVVIDYYARESLGKMAKMFYQYGLFKPLVNKKLGSPATLRQFVPPLFAAGIMAGAVLSLINLKFLLLYSGVLLAYLSLSLFFSFRSGLKQKQASLVFILPLVFLIIHLSYGWGYLAGLIKFNLFRKQTFNVNVNR